MTIRITKETDLITVERINLCLYGAPGIGKTTLGFTADKPLLLDADEGAYRAQNRKDSVIVKAWKDVCDMDQSDLVPYNTIVVDTAGRMLDKLTADIIVGNPKLGRGGALTLQGYGELKAKFVGWMKMLNAFGKDVVLLCHMDEQRRGDDVIERLDVQGGSKGEIYKSVDAMGKIYIEQKKRLLDFSPRENAYGKNPGQFDILTIPQPVPSDFLAEVIKGIKMSLNALGESRKKEQTMLTDWEMAIADLKTVDDFNRMLIEAMKAPLAVKALLHKAAKMAGLIYDKKMALYQTANLQAEPKAKAKPEKESLFA
jgi:hypothetical protein